MVPTSVDSLQGEAFFLPGLQPPDRPAARRWMAGIACLLLATLPVQAQRQPPNCTGSGLGIVLFADSSDAHIGDTIRYSVTVLNGSKGGAIVCDAVDIQAFLVTPDRVTHPIALVRTTLHSGDSDHYPNVVTYVVRAQDIEADGTVRSTAYDTGVIRQNDTNSEGGANQGVNTEILQPCIRINAACVAGAGGNGPITFTGTVLNCGNNVLLGITVTNNVNGGQALVATIPRLAPGESAPFTGSWLPQDPCVPSNASLLARATDGGTNPRTVTHSTVVTCSSLLNPGLRITKTCPDGPVGAGRLMVFSGSVSNTGNVTLTNIVVVNNRPEPGTPVFTLATLAPGALATFSGSYLAPADCSVTDTLSVTAASICGAPVADTATATCPILATPGIEVTTSCPVSPVVPGGTLHYTGRVRNTGDVTLTNVIVVAHRPVPETVVFTTGSLAPGASATFTGSFQVSTDCCVASGMFRASGNPVCPGPTVTNTFSVLCQIIGIPRIAVTKVCPPSPVKPGEWMKFEGTVSNTGSVTLIDVTVDNNVPGASPFLGPIVLAPGETVKYYAAYRMPADPCESDTVMARGVSVSTAAVVTDAVIVPCAIVTSPALSVTKHCPETIVIKGDRFTYTGIVRNTGDVTLRDVFVVNNTPSNNTPVIGPLTLAPGESTPFSGSYIAPHCCCETVDTLTAQGKDRCTGETLTASSTAFCPLIGLPGIGLVQDCPPSPISVGSVYRFSGFVTNTGDDFLTNVIVLGPQGADAVLLGPINLAPGESEAYSGSYTVLFNTCSAPVTATGQSACGGIVAADTVGCPVATAPQIELTAACPTSPLLPGVPSVHSGTVRNTGNITLTNIIVVSDRPSADTIVFIVPFLSPGASAAFSGTSIVPSDVCSMTTHYKAIAMDMCGLSWVTNSASPLCTITPTPRLSVALSCPAGSVVPGGPITLRGTVRNTGNVTLTEVVVVDSQELPATVLTLPNLAPGASANFATSFTAPFDSCAVSATVTAEGHDRCSADLVRASASANCTLLALPALQITQICPVNPATPGDFLTYSGTVRNAGNVTLNNVVVTNSETGSLPLISLAVLAPGATANFTGNYFAPATGPTTSTSTAHATSRCGGPVVAQASSTCQVLTSPAIAVTKFCPPLPVAPGGTLAFSGTVTNTGNVTLTNVVVVNSQPNPGTTVLGPITLAPGSGLGFTGSYLVPLDVCSSTDTLTVTGTDISTGLTVTHSAAATCPLLTTSAIVVTQVCPVNPATPGGLLNFTGTVRNTGNVTLLNVVVTNNQTGNLPLITLASLAPGATGSFAGSYFAPATGPTTSTSIARATSRCGGPVVEQASSTCQVLTSPAIAVTKLCPPLPVAPGGTLAFSGTVTNTGNVTLTNVVVVNSQPTPGTTVLGPITLAPGSGLGFTGAYLVPLDVCSSIDTLTVTGTDISTGLTVTHSAAATCPLLTTSAIVVTQVCPVNPVTPGGILNFTGTVRNAGNVTLLNVVVTNNQTGNLPLITLASLAPGATGNFAGSYFAPATGPTTSTSIAHATSTCGGPVVAQASSTCAVSTTSGIAVTKLCPPLPVAPGGTLVFSGTVTNTGNVALTNVVVVNSQPTPGTTVLGPITLAPGSGLGFTGAYLVPLDVCSSIDTLTATGTDISTGVTVTHSAAATCPLLTTSAIVVTQVCPLNPATPGGVLNFTGTVRNAGNVTLLNVVVTNNQTGNLPLITLASLAPGATGNFAGSYFAPATGPTTSISIAHATSTCGGPVVAQASSTCAVSTTSGIAVTKLCPPLPVAPGGTLVFSGTVTNTGNVTLTNVVVVNSQPTPGTTVLGPITLAPGSGLGFTGAYLVPLDACSSTDTLTATGTDISTGLTVTASAAALCTLATTPGVSITATCPTEPVIAGSTVVFGGSVGNTGNVTLTNIFVFSSNPTSNTPVLGPIMLSPGAVTSFTGSFIAQSGSNPTTHSTVLTNNLTTLTTNSATVIATNVTITVTPNPATPETFGTIDSPSQAVVDRFTIGPGFDGLTYAGEDHGYGATVLYSMRMDASGTSYFDTLVPSTQTTTDRFDASNRTFTALTYAAGDLGYGPLLFYYLSSDGGGGSTFGSITPGGVVGVVADHFAVGSNFDALAYTATDVGYGANLFYYVRHDADGVSTFGTINPALPGTITDRFTIGTNVDALVFTDLAAPGYGPNHFYYVRHDADGESIFGTVQVTGLTTATVTDRFNVGRNVRELTFTPTDVGFGPNLFYFLRDPVVTFATNILTTFTTNTVITLSTNTVTTLTTNVVTSFTATNTVMVIGMDVCQSRVVAAAADCLGPVALRASEVQRIEEALPPQCQRAVKTGQWWAVQNQPRVR